MEPDNKKEKRKYKKRDSRDERAGYLGGFLAIIAIIVIFAGIKYLNNGNGKVAGVNTDTKKEQQELQVEKERAKENVKGDLNKRLEKIKSDINELNALDVTTQSPQVKKIIEDLKSLQNLPKDQAKNVCQQVCSNFE